MLDIPNIYIYVEEATYLALCLQPQKKDVLLLQKAKCRYNGGISVRILDVVQLKKCWVTVIRRNKISTLV